MLASENFVIVGPGIGLPPVRRQAITWTYGDLLSVGPSETNYD